MSEVKRIGIVVLSMLVGVAIAVSPVAAKKKSGPSCKQIKEAVTGGKSEADVAKEMGVSDARVKSCMNPAPAKKKSAKKAESATKAE